MVLKKNKKYVTLLKTNNNKGLNMINENGLDLYKSMNKTDLNRVVLNEKLKNVVLKDMPNNYTDIEKAIYVYIKLCKTLTYDEEFYSNNQQGMIAEIHQDIKKIGSITPENSKIVCYEFAYIYGKFLEDLNVDFLINDKYGYGNSHSNVTFYEGGFLVKADSVSTIISGDLYNAKINNNLIGLNCSGDDAKQKEFSNIYLKVYQDIILKEEEKETDQDNIEMFLEEFSEMCETETVTKEQKIKILEKQCEIAQQLPEMEKVSYVLLLSKAIFEQEKTNKQFDVTILSGKVLDGFRLKSTPVLIFSFNNDSFEKSELNTYKVLHGSKLETIEKETIKNNFEQGIFKHITTGVKQKHVIPGIDDGGKEKC